MQSPHFDVTSFISRGTYSMVYEAHPKQGSGNATTYTLKRMFLQNPSAVKCALREHHTLVRLSLHQHQSAFLATLICSLRIHGSPTFVLRKGSNVDLLSLTRYLDGVQEDDALFYSSEIMCGSQCLHAICIVHIDFKSETILLSYSGHVLITDFDRSYDMSEGRILAEAHDFRTTLQ